MQPQQEWLGSPVQTFRKLGIAVVVVFELYFVAHKVVLTGERQQ